MDKTIILDRDGVINFDSKEYIKSPEEWYPIPGSLEAIGKLTKAGYQVAIATNQSGIARGYYTLATLAAIHYKLVQAVENMGGKITLICFCPHGPDDQCLCRKPKPGLLHEIATRLQITLHNIPVVGDSKRDLEAALAVNAQPILVKTGNGQKLFNDHLYPKETLIYDDLAQFVDVFLQ